MIPCMLNKCRNDFNVASEYLNHLKEYHEVPREYRYRCTVGACRQVFSKFYPFKKHIYHHQELMQSNNSASTTASEVTEPIESQILHTNIDLPPSKSNRVTHDSSEVNISKTHIDMIEKSALNFTLNLHAKNNFTRKDV